MNSPQVEISTDRERLNLLMIQRFLAEETYWARGRGPKQVATSIQHSVPFGLYVDDEQVGFSRVLTDYVAMAYLLDVFILPAHRNRGLGAVLVRHVLAFPDFANVQKWLLKTRDAQSFYERLGFVVVDDPDGLMVLAPTT